MRQLSSLALALLATVSSYAADSTYESKVNQRGHPIYAAQARTTGLRGIESCIEPTTVNDVVIYQCVGTKELPARITVGIIDNKKISIYDRPPYTLGDGPDMFAIEKTNGRTKAIYVFSLEKGTGSSAPLFSQEEKLAADKQTSDKRLHYFLAVNGCDRQVMQQKAKQLTTLDDGILTVQYGSGWLPTWVVRKKIQSHSADFEQLYRLDGFDTTAVQRALNHLSLVNKLWHDAAHQYGCQQ